MEEVNHIVKQIVSESSFEAFYSYLPTANYKRKRKRLAKSLKKQVRNRLPTAQAHEIKEDLVKQLNMKYNHTEKEGETNVYYDDELDTFLSESEDEEEYKSTGSDKYGRQRLNKYHTLDETERKKMKFDKDLSGKDEGCDLKKIDNVMRHPICQRLITQNHFLSQRSKELSKLKLTPQLSMRSIQIADAALFSDHLGFSDGLLLETPVDISNAIANDHISRYELLATTEMHEISRILLKNGEFLVKKNLRRSLQLPFEKKLSLLSYEAKILKLIDRHKNVLYSHGLMVAKGEPSIILEYHSMENLYDMFKGRGCIDAVVAKNLARGIADGLLHIHGSGVVHNMLVSSNVAIQSNSSFFVPVIIGFSSACRMASSKPLTYSQQSRFKSCTHLPKKVLSGRSPPSESSDIFSYGRLIQRLFVKVKDELSDKRQLEIFIRNCIREDPDAVSNFLVHVIDMFVL